MRKELRHMLPVMPPPKIDPDIRVSLNREPVLSALAYERKGSVWTWTAPILRMAGYREVWCNGLQMSVLKAGSGADGRLPAAPQLLTGHEIDGRLFVPATAWVRLGWGMAWIPTEKRLHLVLPSPRIDRR